MVDKVHGVIGFLSQTPDIPILLYSIPDTLVGLILHLRHARHRDTGAIWKDDETEVVVVSHLTNLRQSLVLEG